MTRITIRDDATQVELETEFTPVQPLTPGQRVRIFNRSDGSYVLKIGRNAMDLVGILDGNGVHLSIEEINAVIADQNHRV